MPGVEWLRPEFQGRDDELATRDEYETLTRNAGNVVTAQALSSAFKRYANRVPQTVKKFGKQKWFAIKELDAFFSWIAENSGTRSEADIKDAEIANLKVAIGEAEERIIKHKEALSKAERDLAYRKKKLRRAEEDAAFLKQGS